MSGTERPACEHVRRALNAILASEAFARSERLRSFLAYVVDSELSGKAAQLKGYSIAIDVFGRSHGFDAGNDPLVRVQAGKLRKLLDHYYETEGAEQRLRIRVPLGSYVPEYSLADEAEEQPVPCERVPLARACRQKLKVRRSWLPAPVSSPLALFSLLPLVFLAPSVYPEPTNAAIDKAQRVLTVQSTFANRAQALPQLHIQQCWPAGGDCNALARAIAGAAGYHRTVHLSESRETPDPPPLSYAIRIENRADGRGIYARLIHERSGETVYSRHFSSAQLGSDAGLTFEAVAFAAQALSAHGPLYRHALRSGTASSIMECLAREERQPPRGMPHPGPGAACATAAPAALADAAASQAAGMPLRR